MSFANSHLNIRDDLDRLNAALEGLQSIGEGDLHCARVTERRESSSEMEAGRESEPFPPAAFAFRRAFRVKALDLLGLREIVARLNVLRRCSINDRRESFDCCPEGVQLGANVEACTCAHVITHCSPDCRLLELESGLDVADQVRNTHDSSPSVGTRLHGSEAAEARPPADAADPTEGEPQDRGVQ